MTFSSNIDDGENTDEILELLEIGDNQAQNSIDIGLNDVDVQVKSMEAEINCLTYKNKLSVSSSNSNSSNIEVEQTKLNIPDNEIYNLSNTAQIKFGLLKKIELKIGKHH